MEVAEDGRRVQVARRCLAEGGADDEAQALLMVRARVRVRLLG